MTALIAAMLGANAAIAFVFCAGVWKRAGGVSFAWPPSFLRVVVAWLGDKGIWLAAITYLWARQRVGYTDAATDFDRWLYPATLGLFTFWHGYAAWCWITGRATVAEFAPPTIDRDEVTGVVYERRTGPPDRRRRTDRRRGDG